MSIGFASEAYYGYDISALAFDHRSNYFTHTFESLHHMTYWFMYKKDVSSRFVLTLFCTSFPFFTFDIWIAIAALYFIINISIRSVCAFLFFCLTCTTGVSDITKYFNMAALVKVIWLLRLD